MCVCACRPANDFRLFVGDLGNEVTTEMLAKEFQKYKTFAKAKVWYTTTLHSTLHSALHYTVLHCTALYTTLCTTLHYTLHLLLCITVPLHHYYTCKVLYYITIALHYHHPIVSPLLNI